MRKRNDNKIDESQLISNAQERYNAMCNWYGKANVTEYVSVTHLLYVIV